MMYVFIAALVVVSLMAAAVIELARRERRRTTPSPETQRIEAAAAQGLRDAHRQAYAYQQFGNPRSVRALRNRNSL